MYNMHNLYIMMFVVVVNVLSLSSSSQISTKLRNTFNDVRIDSYQSLENPIKVYDVEYKDLFQLEKVKKYLDANHNEMFYVKQKICDDIFKYFKKDDFKVYSRIKSPSSIFSKTGRRRKLTTMNDILAIRIIVRGDTGYYDIFKFVSFVTQNYIVINMKDYITNPKTNGYQSFHVSCYVQDSEFPVEIQIRNENMDFDANFGSASKYKS